MQQNREECQHYSDIKQIQSLIEEALLAVNRAGIMVFCKQQLPYGTQLFLEGQGENGLINVYFSKKKGFSFINCSGNATAEKVITLLRGAAHQSGSTDRGEVDKQEAALRSWVGTDESGKGDFFGPLVVAGFFITRALEQEVIQQGVVDSKRLSARQIRTVAGVLRKRYAPNIAVVAPSNTRYNELYVTFTNLNRFLAWGHARVIRNLIDQWHGKEGVTVDGAVADQFGNVTDIRRALSSMEQVRLIQRPRAESNTAVAAASIIARDVFTKKIELLQEEYGITLPLGAGPQVLAAAKMFAEKYGREKLAAVAKIHFKTYQQI